MDPTSHPPLSLPFLLLRVGNASPITPFFGKMKAVTTLAVVYRSVNMVCRG
ncbi:hypothetical protein Hanom_Chr16g01470431 [Helianthus anomalus]